MLALQKRMDVISNNMANAGTNGFKKDTTVLESFPDLMTKIVRDQDSFTGRPRDIGTMELGSDVGEVYTYFTQGQIAKTDNELDMAIRDSDSAFFTVAVPNADGDIAVFFTRDGSFTRGQIIVWLRMTGIPCWAKTVLFCWKAARSPWMRTAI